MWERMRKRRENKRHPWGFTGLGKESICLCSLFLHLSASDSKNLVNMPRLTQICTVLGVLRKLYKQVTMDRASHISKGKKSYPRNC